MQEEVNEKTISLCIKGGKITAQILKAALIKLLAEMDKKKKQQEKGKGQCKRTGKQSMYGRMIEIYLYTSLAPIPFATMSNREWGHVGTNYFRGLFALAFQAFLMMVCVAIYAALIGSIRVSSDIHSALFGTMAYTVILCFSLLKTGSLSKQIFGSH